MIIQQGNTLDIFLQIFYQISQRRIDSYTFKDEPDEMMNMMNQLMMMMMMIMMMMMMMLMLMLMRRRR